MLSYKVRTYPNGSVLKLGTTALNELRVVYKLGQVPYATLVLPISEWTVFDTRVEVEITIDDHVFCGLVEQVVVNKAKEQVEINMSQIIGEWDYESIPINVTVKQTPLADIYGTLNFGLPSWTVDIQDTATIEYRYSRQSKLEALTATVENTEDIFWRIKQCECRVLEIGRFGQDSGYMIAQGDPSDKVIAIIEEPIINVDFTKLVNRAVVLSGNVSPGMATMTLREIFNDVTLQDANFPVSISGNAINTEITYAPLDGIERSPNNTEEYEITDTDSVAREGGQIYMATFTENDFYPIPDTDEPIENADRIEMARKVYARAIRRLIRSRRGQSYRLDVTALPCDVNVGDRIRFRYSNKTVKTNACTYDSKDEHLKVDQLFYVSEISRRWDNTLQEIDTIQLDEYLREDRDIKEY